MKKNGAKLFQKQNNQKIKITTHLRQTKERFLFP